MGGKDDVIVGFKYHLGMQQVLCHGPIDEIVQIDIGDRMAWNTGQTGSGTITIDEKKLFGGKDREGGISGDIDIAMGEPTQTANAYLESILSPYDDDMPLPAFRGVVSAYLKQVYIGLNPYIKPWKWKIKRTQIGHDGAAMWYIAKADIDGDMNPAHIIRECLVSSDWGLGYPTSTIDDTAFQDAADTLVDEDFGLSFLWVRQQSIEDFIHLVEKYILGRVYVDPVTGLFVLKLIRNDYVVDDLPLFDESNTLSCDKYQRRGWGETTNEVTVIYTDRETGKGKPVTIQNLANIQQQGRVVTMTTDYSAISSPSLAARVCQRDLGVFSAPLATLEITVNRDAWALMPGEAFKFTWPENDIDELIFRVGELNLGNIDAGEIKITAIEDYFTLPSGSYWEEQPPGWIDPNGPPDIDTITTEQDIMELPYYEVVQRISEADQQFLDPDFGFAGVCEREPHGNNFWYGYNLYTSANNDAPPVTPPIEESSYDYDIDISVGNDLDDTIAAGATKIFRMQFAPAAGQAIVHFSAVSLGGNICFRFSVVHYNYAQTFCGPESSASIASDATETSWVVARDGYFYIEMHNEGSAGTFRFDWHKQANY